MKRPLEPPLSPGETDLRACLRDRRAFWLYGFEGCGKTAHLRRATDGLDTAHNVEIVSLYPDTSTEAWATKLFEALPDATNLGVEAADLETTWQRWCDIYAEHRDDIFVVIDGWQWMPAELRRLGAERVLRDGLSCGFVACAAPRTYLRTAQVLRLDVIECPPFVPQQDSSTVLAALCRDLLEGLTDESKRALAPLAHLPCPLDSAVVWSHFDRDALLPALEVGLLYEHIGSVTVAPPLKAALTDMLEPTGEQWMELLECIWDVFCAADRETDCGTVDPALLQATLDVFARASRALEDPSEAERTFLKEVMASLDAHFRTLLTPTRLPAALAALEQIPSRLQQAMPAARLRLGQCLTAAGRSDEADRLLDGLVRMKHTDAGKRAFLWTQMFAALGGDADAAIEALETFLDERIEPGEPLDAVARLVLARILTTRGMFRRAIDVAGDGIHAARANEAVRDLHMLRTMRGMSLALTDERDAGIDLVNDACDTLRDLGFELAYVEARHILATLYLELGEYENARAELQTVRPEYERLRDTRNLQLVDLEEHIIALLLAEDEPPPRAELTMTPAPSDWSYFGAELNFAEALHAIHQGDAAAALDRLHKSVHAHLSRGNLQALRRLLRHYLPLLLDSGEFSKARELLSALDAARLAEQRMRDIAGLIIDALWLSGDFGEWDMCDDVIEVGGPPTLFPRSLGHAAAETMGAWMERWEHTVAGEAGPISNNSGIVGCSELAPLYRGWQKLWAGDLVGSRRELLLCEELDLEGSLFGFLRGLLHHAVRADPRADMLRWHAEMLEFWRRLSPMIVLQQLGFWEKLLDRRRTDMAPALAETLESWLDIIQKWRVEGAMLVDESLGAVFIDGRRIELGNDTVAFSALSFLAKRAPDAPPVAVDELFEAVWDRPFNPQSSHNNVYVTIGNLRQELDLDDASKSVIHLERGVGYSISMPVVVAKSV
ncbi:hypothetical protein FIV42_23585 [Persicimonas caeni]|uniref:OmpR/PhoB-type domain-containing protein n=1 Tax=Persicimonas caeni TaxID=2292766 RepID=A0A4Y6Q038_PERCE|nr:winged helix-turn-helix domain-containing protein [Persicimonas caeni]QDG53617.1 hypothetical protein FIV42_23585 [Persicimonas caeni]QED34838.1 hypothetical protein FRD00_23580 [Persicimonas caeni]